MNRHTCTVNYSMYRVDAFRTSSRLRATYPTLLQWRGRYDFSRLKTSRLLPHTSVLVIECFLTRSMLILKCIYTLFTVIFSPAQYQNRCFKLITHCFFYCLLLCVEYFTVTHNVHALMLPDSASFIMIQLHM